MIYISVYTGYFMNVLLTMCQYYFVLVGKTLYVYVLWGWWATSGKSTLKCWLWLDINIEKIYIICNKDKTTCNVDVHY